MWESFERLKAKKFMKEAEKEKKEGMQGQWQHESLANENLEQVKCLKDTDCTPRMLKQGIVALKKKENFKASTRLKQRPRNGPSKEAVEKSGRRGGGKIVHRAKNEVEEYRLLAAHLCPNCKSFPLEDNVWWGFQLARITAAGGARSVDKKYDWRAPNRLLVVQTGDSASQAKVVKAHAVPQGLCENMMSALKLLASQQKNGDSPSPKHCSKTF